MVVAGPGTGKTTVLTLRIANILRQTDTPPDGILALTFTESGVRAIRQKLREIIKERAEGVKIYTYHGFASAVMSEFPEHFPLLSGFKQMSDLEAEMIIRDILKDKKYKALRPLGAPDFYVMPIISAIREAKKEIWNPDRLREFADEEKRRVEEDPNSVSTRGKSKGEMKADALKRIERSEKTLLLADIFESYEEYKIKEKKRDYEDLIYSLVEALDKDELLLRLIQEKYLYIHIDEHQDTNDSQNLIIGKLADFFDTPNLFIVGDEKQAIFRFQGASVLNFLAFEKKWPDIKIISLDENYRSHQHILDAVFSMIDRNYAAGEYEHLRIKLQARSEQKASPIKVVLAGNVEASEGYLVKHLEEISQRGDETSAVIVRKNRDVERILALLKRRAIPASAERGADIFTHPIGSLFFDVLEYLSDVSKVESLARTLAGGLWRLSLGQRADLIRRIRAGETDEVEKVLPDLRELLLLLSRSGAVEYLIKAGEMSGLEEKAARDPLSTEVWRMIISLSGELARSKDIDSPIELARELLEYRKNGRKNVKVDSGFPDSKIFVMTAHGSKGLEYDHVFLPYASNEAWMSKRRGNFFALPREENEEDNIKDERRLFYVALTRARKDAHIMVPLDDGSGKERTPLRFLDELSPLSVSKTEIPRAEPLGSKEGSMDLESKDRSDLADFARRTIRENGLSVTALNNFCRCPSEFFFKNIMKLPEPPMVAAEKGTAMHEALASVWKLDKKTEKLIASAISLEVENYFKRSLLPKFEKEALIEELLADAPLVARSLLDHFNQTGNVLVETWMEVPFEDRGTKENIRLHGKLDAVVDTGSEIRVYDYKTAEKKSENAIRGLTQGSDGNYFRQLIFYKMLLSENKKYKGRDIVPTLVFVKPDHKGLCAEISLSVGSEDVLRVKGEIDDLLKSVEMGSLLDQTCDDPECTFCRLRDSLFI